MKKKLTILKQFLKFRKPESLKIVVYCVLTAAIFWFFSALNKKYDSSLNYPVTWVFDQEKFIIVKEPPKKIQINVSGLGWNLLRVNAGLGLAPIHLKLNDPANNPSLSSNYFSTQVAEALDQLQLNYIVEDSLFFDIDQKITKKFPIYIDSANIGLEKGYRIVSPITFDTKWINITGAKKILEKMQKDTFLVHVIETNINDDFSKEVPLQLEYPNLMQVKPQTIKVTFEVAKFIDQEIKLPITCINTKLPKKFFIKDSLTNIHYLVQENLKDSISAKLFLAIADFKSVSKIDSTLTLTLKTKSKLIINPYFSFAQIKIYYNE